MRKANALLGLLLFPVFMFAQIKDTVRIHTLLWKISGNGLKQDSYLMGTHHLFGGSFLDSLTGVMDIFNQADVLIGETYADSNANAVQADAGTQRNDYIPYSKLFTKEEYARVNKYLSSINVVLLKSLDSAQFPAWRLYFLVQMDYFSKKFNTATLTESAMDYQLYNIAQGKGLKTIGLDNLSKWKSGSPDELFGKPQDLADAVVSMINYIEKGIPSIHISIPMQEFGTIKDYRDLNIEYQFNVTIPGKNIPQIKELVLLRNRAWLKVLPSLLKTHSCFIAVGLKHLMHREGLIMQLKRMGYEVTPVAIQRK